MFSKTKKAHTFIKERLQKKVCERHQNLPEEEKEKNGNMVANDIKTFVNMKKKG